MSHTGVSMALRAFSPISYGVHMYDMTTPEGMRHILDDRLNVRRPRILESIDYYEGRQRLAFASSKFRSTFGSLFNSFSDNWCNLIVDSVEERLNVEGFQMGSIDDGGDSEAWDIWQYNALDLNSQLAHREALITGSAFVTVWGGEDPRFPEISVESSQQVVLAYEPGNRRKRTAAWKRWLDDDNYLYGTLYTPEAIYKYRSVSRYNYENELETTIKTKAFAPGTRVQWIPRPGEEEPIPNPLGIVPVVELRNMPQILGDGHSEIASIIPLQDAANKLIADMLVAAEYSAFRQRWVTGLEIPTDSNGNPVEPFEAAVNRVWHAEDPETKFGEFSQTDLTQYVKAVELIVQHAATISRTPPHYFLLNGGQAPSGEAITSAEAGLVSKCKRRMRSFEEGWEEVMRLAFLVRGDLERGRAFDAQVIWGDPAYRSQSALIDSLVKLDYLGVPRTQLWSDAGYSPQQVERFEEYNEQKQEELAAQGLTEETAPPNLPSTQEPS